MQMVGIRSDKIISTWQACGNKHAKFVHNDQYVLQTQCTEQKSDVHVNPVFALCTNIIHWKLSNVKAIFMF